jgi:hypothetical protein
MKKLITSVSGIAFALLINNTSVAQGCSDAGFCAMGAFKPFNPKAASYDNKLKFGLSFGQADKSISTIGNYIEYGRTLTPTIGLDVKLTTLSQSGNSVSSFGLADLFVNGSFKLNDDVKLAVGAKFPLNDGNTKKNNLPLPMDYQASLGTVDLIAGIAYNVKNFQLFAALQQPVSQNKNQYLGALYPANSKLSTFFNSRNFKRSGDVLLRIAYPVTVNNKFKITPSLLPIYHLANDKFTSFTNVETEIKDSKGLTLNANVYLDFEVNKKSNFQITVGSPFVVRKARPDGLTRSVVINAEYAIKF